MNLEEQMWAGIVLAILLGLFASFINVFFM